MALVKFQSRIISGRRAPFSSHTSRQPHYTISRERDVTAGREKSKRRGKCTTEGIAARRDSAISRRRSRIRMLAPFQHPKYNAGLFQSRTRGGAPRRVPDLTRSGTRRGFHKRARNSSSRCSGLVASGSNAKSLQSPLNFHGTQKKFSGEFSGTGGGCKVHGVLCVFIPRYRVSQSTRLN